jgi:hypothetical protein
MPLLLLRNQPNPSSLRQHTVGLEFLFRSCTLKLFYSQSSFLPSLSLTSYFPVASPHVSCAHPTGTPSNSLIYATFKNFFSSPTKLFPSVVRYTYNDPSCGVRKVLAISPTATLVSEFAA